MRVTVLWCRVWCLDLPSHPFTLEPCLLQGWFSRGSLENSDFKACPQPPLPDSLCGLSLVSHQSVTKFSHPTQGPELGCWDPGDRFIWRWHKVSDALVNPGSWAMFISFGSWEHLLTCQRCSWVRQDWKLRWSRQWSQPLFWMMLCRGKGLM